jgi:arylsulfatase A-like enzyme
MLAAKPSIIFILIDTLRADHLGCYGYERRTSPFIDYVASQGLRFEQVTSPAPWTIPVHASLFTGKYPAEHGAHQRHIELGTELPTLPEQLGKVGYRTVGFSNNPWVGRITSLDRGFSEFTEIAAPVPGRVKRSKMLRRFIGLSRAAGFRYPRRAERTLRLAENWIGDHFRSNPKRPFFVFVNLMEVHAPYSPPRSFVEPFLAPGTDINQLYSIEQDFDLYNSGMLPLTRERRSGLTSLYDGEIAYVDEQIERFVEGLRKDGVLDDLMLVLTSDHGENLGEHGLMDHQFCVYNTLLHVPLVIHWPAAIEGGEVYQNHVQWLHLYDTIASLAGVSLEHLAPNRPHSLLDEAHGFIEPTEYAFAEYFEPGLALRLIRRHYPDFDDPNMISAMTSVRDGRFKLILRERADDEFFDLATDGEEECNLLGHTLSADESRLRSALHDWRQGLTATKFANSGIDDVITRMDAETAQRLRGLGYLA